MELPGHTLDHIAFYSFNNGNPILFCGDVLFPSGCGRIFEGTYEQMHQSLLQIKSLPKIQKFIVVMNILYLILILQKLLNLLIRILFQDIMKSKS